MKRPQPVAPRPEHQRPVACRHVEHWTLRLYVAGQTPKSVAALRNLRLLCEEHLPGRYTIEVVDLLESPHLARADGVVAIPTVVRHRPSPTKRLIGALTDRRVALDALDLDATT